MREHFRNILIATATFAEFDKAPLVLLEERGFNCVLNLRRRKLEDAEVIQLGKGAVGIIAGTERLGEEVFSQLPELKVVSRCGSGMDSVDLESAKKRGIEVYNTPDAPTRAVAELTVGLILNLLRKVYKMDAVMKSGRWEQMTGELLYGMRIGIIGLGHIGQMVCELLSAFGAQLAYCDIEPKRPLINCSRKRFEEILAWADIVTLHMSCSQGCKPIIGKRELGLMKKGSWFINLSRGRAVDEKALYLALKDGYLQGAALDVFQQEPYRGPLKELDNVILTPHIGSYAKEAVVKMELGAVRNLLKGLGCGVD